jgi:LuxR family maltose regulon positive regulatory protein
VSGAKCFTLDEAAEFLNQAMGLSLSAQDIDALEKRTEGWIAGLQLAALVLARDVQIRSNL